MFILDAALARRANDHNPIRVGMIGAGVMARGIALQVATACPGIRIAAIANRTLDKARQAYEEAGAKEVIECRNADDLACALGAGQPAITPDPVHLAEADGIDVLLEVTGAIEGALPVILSGIENRKHIVLMNAALDGTLGPILKAKADQAGVVYTNVDGNHPGAMMNLYRFVRGIGVKPVLCGRITERHLPYRTPLTQAELARRWGQRPSMATVIADGTKLSFEQAIIANGTGMRVARRGMHGPIVPPGTSIENAASFYPREELTDGPGIVDYVVGAAPGRGVFVLGVAEHPRQRRYLQLYGLGDGPIYCFFKPCQLGHLEVPNTIARAVLFRDAALAPLSAPVVEVIAVAKRNLKAGEILDDHGHFMTYGVAENADVVASANLLPIGVAPGCRLKRNLTRDDVLTYEDVELPPGRLCDKLRQEQAEYFGLLADQRIAL